MIFSDRVQSSTLISEIISSNIVLVPIELSLVAEMEINLPDSGNPQDILKESAESVWHLIAFDPCRGKKRDAWNRTWSLYWCRAKALWGVEIWGQGWSRCQGYVKNSFLSVSKGVTSDSEKPNWSELIGVFFLRSYFVIMMLSWSTLLPWLCWEPGDWAPTTAFFAMRSAVQCHLRSQGCDGWDSSIALGATWATGSGWGELSASKRIEIFIYYCNPKRSKNQVFQTQTSKQTGWYFSYISYTTSTKSQDQTLHVCHFMGDERREVFFSHCKVLVLKEVLQPSEVQQPLGFNWQRRHRRCS